MPHTIYKSFNISDLSNPLLICGIHNIRMFHNSVFSTEQDLRTRIDKYWQEWELQEQHRRSVNYGLALRRVTEDEQMEYDRDMFSDKMEQYYEREAWEGRND